MSQHADITELSDPQDMSVDATARTSVPEIKVLRGLPSDEDIAALVTVLAGSGGGGGADVGPQELNRWGHPVDGLRYSVFSYHAVTLVERTHMRR